LICLFLSRQKKTVNKSPFIIRYAFDYTLSPIK
jgi:hypothetical protein